MSEAWGRRTSPGSPRRLRPRDLYVAGSAVRPAMMRQAQPGDIHLIKHVIVIMQENRSFDFLFRNVPTTDHLHKNFRPLDVLVMSSLVPALRGDGTGSMTGR